MSIIELVDTSHHHAEIEGSNLDYSADPEKAASSGGIHYKRLGFHDIAPYYDMPDDLTNWLVFMERPLAV